MKERLINNWPIKLLSLVFAFFIWLAIVNIDNPVKTEPFTIPLEYENQDVLLQRGKSATILGKKTATFNVSKERKALADISESDFKAVADFNKMYQDTQVPITVTCINGKVEQKDITLVTRSLEVELQNIKQVQQNIEVSIIGRPADGYAVGAVTPEPSSVMVTGPESFASIVRKAVVTVDVSNLSADTTIAAELELYDGNGTRLDPENEQDVSLDITEPIQVKVTVQRVQKVSIVPVVIGEDNVAAGYRYTGVEVSPDTISVTGSDAALAKLFSIEIKEGLDVSRQSADVVKEFDIRGHLPEGVTVTGDYMVKVTLKIEPLVQRDFVINTGILEVQNVPDGLNYSFIDSTVLITIRGLAADLDLLEANGLKGVVDLKGLAAGDQPVLVKPVINAADYEQVGSCQVQMRLAEPATEPAANESSGGSIEDTLPDDNGNSESGSDSTS